MLVLEAERARMVVDPGAGGRVASLEVAGLELLVSRIDDVLRWGCYPMAPFTGRLAHGRLAWAGRVHQLPCNLRLL